MRAANETRYIRLDVLCPADCFKMEEKSALLGGQSNTGHLVDYGTAVSRASASPSPMNGVEKTTTADREHHAETDSGSRFDYSHSVEANGTLANGRSTPKDAAETVTGGAKPALVLSRLRKAVVFVVIGMNALFVMICLSIMIPFFPTEAAEKDPNPDSVAGLTAIGFIFSITAFMEFLTAPFVGKVLPTSGPKIIVVLGGVLVGGVIIMFAFVDRIDDWITFLVICYALRAVQGVGTAFNITASFALLVGVFPKSISLVSGLLRAFAGVGLVIGPALSGFIYDEHGFALPFLVYGGIMLASALAVLFALPGEVDAGEDKKSSDILKSTVKLPWAILWLAFSLVVGAAVGLLEPALSPYLREEFKISPSQVGLVFLLHSVIFVIAAPITGFVGDRWLRAKYLAMIGAVLQGVGLLFLGPVQVFGFIEPALWKSVVCMAIIGGGSGMSQTAFAPGMLEAMYEAGFEDSVELHGTVAGMLTAFFSLGIAVGPTVGNAATGAFGFPDAAALFSALELATGLAFVLLEMYDRFKRRYRRYDVQQTPLLKESQATTPM